MCTVALLFKPDLIAARMRIRSRLLILVITILIPSLIGAGLGVYYIYTEQQKSYRGTIQNLAHAMALLLDKEMSGRIKTLQTLSGSPTITDNNLPGFYRYAREVASDWGTTIILSDLSGQQFMNTRTPFGTENLPKTTPSLMTLRQQRGPEAALVSDVYYAPLGKSRSFAIQIPVKRDGRILYYLSMGAFTSYLQPLLQEQKLPQGWIGTIMDRQGVVAARTHDPEKFVGAVADATLRKKIAANPEGTNDGTTLDGVPVTAFYSRAPKSEWTFIVSVPRTVLREAALQATALVSLIAVLLLGSGVAAAIFIARKTAKPMEDLRQLAAELGQGKPIARQSTGVLEIDAVSLEMARASEQIGSAKAELERRVADAVAMAERSQRALLQSQKLEALGRLTGGIAHDFNNVTQTLSTGLQLVLLTAAEPRIKQTVAACQRAIERATELTRQLMSFGRVQDAHLETVNLARRMEEITPLLKGGLKSNIALQFDIAEDLWPVTIDPTQFDLAMLNVAINARDAMAEGGLLQIHMRNTSRQEPSSDLAVGDYVQISVIDNGDGMEQDVLSKALDPFFTTKPVGKGSGMGLPQAYGFAKQNGGSLTIESDPGSGTKIIFYLPRAQSSVPSKSPTRQHSLPATRNQGGRILFVEDDPLVSAVVAPALRAAGFTVQEAANGEQALEQLTNNGPFDVVFSDIVMPGSISGIDLAKHSSKLHPKTRVVLATGYSERRVAVPGVEILAKPYDVADAVEMLSK